MAGSYYVVTVYNAAIMYLIHEGDGGRWTRQQAWDIRAAAMAFAPTRSGRLKMSHVVEQPRDEQGRFRKGFAIVADTGYAGWVHGGTGGRGRIIRPRTKKAMSLPPGYGWPKVVTKRVHGQDANPWLRVAGELIAGRSR